MKIQITPSMAFGRIYAPPSKSISHRMLLAASLSSGTSYIENIAFSQDILATISCLENLGAKIEKSESSVKVTGVSPEDMNSAILNCNECGSTLRFLIPIAFISGKKMVFKGTQKLLSRPLSIYNEIAKENDIQFDLSASSLTVCGKIKPNTFKVLGNISSQFISGLLFALPLLDGTSKIEIIPPIESKSYILLTLKTLSDFGIKTEFQNNTITILGNQKYTQFNGTIEGDASNAAFFDSLNFLGGNVKIDGINPNTLQGDGIFHALFEDIKSKKNIDLSNCPDLGPIAFVLAAFLGGGHFTGTKRLSLKESDRCKSMQDELLKFGISSQILENEMNILSSKLLPPQSELSSHNDHRIAMALSILMTKTGGVLNGAESVSKSMPNFFEELSRLNIEVNKIELD